jgi:5S rRNA maturation endonuclease (ribonuclease M5)
VEAKKILNDALRNLQDSLYNLGVIIFRDVDECGKYRTWKMRKILQIIKLIVMKFFPLSCYFYRPRSKYSS